MKINAVFVFCLFLTSFLPSLKGNAQFQIDESDELHRSEFTYGVNFNTNGGLLGGVLLKYALRSGTKRAYHHIYLEAVNLKNSKEQRSTSQRTGRPFIPYKLNYLYAVRAMYGREWVLFRKAKKQGVQVHLITAAGPSFGFVCPYLIDYDNGKFNDIVYNPAIHDVAKIDGYGNFVKGWGMAKLTTGACFKAALSFEIGAFKQSVTGFEAGLMVDAYPKAIPLLYGTEYTGVFKSIYLTIYFGSRW
jgi:hypothetical protein